MEQWSAQSQNTLVIVFYEQEVNKNEFFKQISLTANGILSKIFEKKLFWTMTNGQLPL